MKSPMDDSLILLNRIIVWQKDEIPLETEMRLRERVVEALKLQDKNRRWTTSKAYECARDSRYEESETQSINWFIPEDA